MEKEEHLQKAAEESGLQNDLILRDRLALLRTQLANERTLFAYIRTSLYLITAGIGILEIESVRHLTFIAYASLFFSVFLFFKGILKYYQLNKRLKHYSEAGLIKKSHPL